MDIFGGSIKLDWFKGSFLCTLGCFLKVKSRMGIFLRGCLYFKYFLGIPDTPDIFGGKYRCWVQGIHDFSSKAHSSNATFCRI